MQPLTGGRPEVIYRNNNVIRPLNDYSASVHLLLTHLNNKGFTQSPRFIKTEANTEVLSFIEGDTYNYPLKGPIASEQALISGAKLLRQLHDTSADFLAIHESLENQWMLPSREPQEVICHGDFTPYNVALKGDQVVGVFDFDTAHPAPRMWDIAYSIYCWAPFKTDPVDALGSRKEQIKRAKVFCDSYGVTNKSRESLVQTMIARLQALVDYMCQQASTGNMQFANNITDSHHLSYLKDIRYLQHNEELIIAGICKA